MTVVVRQDGAVRVLSLNRPHVHNAIDDATADALDTAFRDAAADPAVSVILLRGEGRSFCSPAARIPAGRVGEPRELGVGGHLDVLAVRRLSERPHAGPGRRELAAPRTDDAGVPCRCVNGSPTWARSESCSTAPISWQGPRFGLISYMIEFS